MSPYVLMGVTPAALVIGSIVGARRMGFGTGILGLRLPPSGSAVLALAGFLLLATASELLYRHWGLAEGTGDWRGKYEPGPLAVRMVFAAVVFPIAEELFFRGFLFALIRRKAGEIAAVAGSAVLFTLLHLQYDARALFLVLIDALFFALVRSRTNSVLLTMVLHVLGNSYAVWQRL